MNRVLYIDYIKAFSMLAVIFLHNSAPLLISEINLSYWMVGNIYDSMMRMAVPLFFMVSGVLFLNQKNESLSIFFKKRFFKVIIPLLAWSFFYILLKKYGLTQNINILKEVITSLNKPEFYHLWFLYTIIGIYLILPILKVFIQHASQSIQIYFIILWIISVFIIPCINLFTNLSLNSYMPMMAGYVGYLILGYQISKIDIRKKLFYLSIFFIIFSTMGTIMGTYYLSERSNTFIDFFYGPFSISTLIQAVAYFITIKYTVDNFLYKYVTLTKAITHISITSLGIYLIHPFIMIILRENRNNCFRKQPLNIYSYGKYFNIFLVFYYNLFSSKSIYWKKDLSISSIRKAQKDMLKIQIFAHTLKT